MPSLLIYFFLFLPLFSCSNNIFELKLMASNKSSTLESPPVNFLCDQGQVPEKKNDQFYQFNKLMKLDYGEIWGSESHARRRRMILQRHPEVAKLLNPDKPYSIILAIFTICFGMTVTYLVKDASWPVFLAVVYVLGGTYGHTLHVLIHDFTHFGGHRNMTVNKIMAILCNIPMGFPSALSFGKHHADHHNYLGQIGKDPDLPVRLESKLSKFFPFKFFFWSLISVFYAFRPMLFYNRKISIDEILNYIFIFVVDYIIYKYWGSGAIIYLLIVAFLSIGPHPAAIHVLAEHFEFVVGQETYDYFGPWNILNLNLGYHIEHHDFPTCPWYNLPKVRALAPQFYDRLPYHTSYTKVLLKFLFDINFNLFNRTIRIDKAEEKKKN